MAGRGGAPRISITGDTAGLERAVKRAKGEVRDLDRTKLGGLSRQSTAASTGILRIGTSASTAAGRVHVSSQRAARSLASIGDGATLAASKAKVGLMALAAAAAAAGVGVGAGVRSFVDFEAAMDRVQAVAGATGAQMKVMNAQAKQLGADTAFSAKQAAEGMYELSTAGFTANQTMKIIPGTLALASASGVDLAQAAELQAAAIRGFGLSAKDANQVADILAKTTNASAVEMEDLAVTLPYVAATAKTTGTSLAETAAMAGLLGNAGIKADKAGTALRTGMLALANPSKKVREELRDVGLNAKNLAGIPLPKTLGQIAGAMKKLPSKGEKLGLVAAVFGREAAPAMLELLDKGKGRIDKLADGLLKSRGAAERTAKVMRGNVKGAWDELTGSIETASITLLERFSPAMQKALRGAAGGVNKGTQFLGDVIGGAAGEGPRGRGYSERAAGAQQMTTGQAIGAKAREIGASIIPIVKQIGAGAAAAGKQLLEAFKPAMPFLQNVLLPLLKGVAIGVGASVVSAFKVLVPVIKIAATALGWIGEKAKPLKGVFQGIGTVIGFVFSGPILKAIGALGKLGSVFRIVGAAAKIAAAPIALTAKLIGPLVSWAGRGAAAVAKFALKWAPLSVAIRGAVFVLGTLIQKFGGVTSAVSGVARKITGPVGRIASSIVGGLKNVGDKVVNGVVQPFFTLHSRVANAVRGKLGDLLSFFGRVGKAIVNAVVDAIKASAGAIAGAIKDAAGGSVKVLGVNINPLSRRGGGRISAFGEGGMVPILAAGGELLMDGNRGMVIPGDPTRDGTLLWTRPGSEVYTAHGQSLLAAGFSRSDALAMQAPHFATGGKVGASWYGGPRDKSTKKPEKGYRGDLLERHPMSFAELGMGNALGGLPYKAPLTITYRGRSVTARKRDIGKGGGSVNGYRRAIDLYYRVAERLGFSGLGVVSITRRTGKDAGSDAGETSVARLASSPLNARSSRLYLGRYKTGLSTAFDAGVEAGYSGARRLIDIPDAITTAQENARARIERSKIPTRDLPSSSSSSRGGTNAAGWVRPVIGGTITSRFGRRSSPGGVGSTNHDGIDIGVPVGTPVRAAGRGRVAVAGVNGGYGNYVAVNHAGGLMSFYGHLSNIGTAVGRRVNRGQRIALSGNSGTSTGPHLHFGMHRNGAAINPASIVRMRGGGRVGRALSGLTSVDALNNAGMEDAMRDFGQVLSMVSGQALRAIANRIESMIGRLARGGFTRQERVQADRLRQAGGLVATEQGRRLGLARGRADVRYAIGQLNTGVAANPIQEAQQAVAAARRQETLARRELYDALRSADPSKIAAAYEQLGEARRGITGALQAEKQAIEDERNAREDNAVARQQALAGLTATAADDVQAATARRDLALSRFQQATAGGSDADIAAAAQELKSAADDLQSASQALREEAYAAFSDNAKTINADLIRAQVDTPNNKSDDLAVQKRALANAEAAYAQAVASNDLDQIISWGQDVQSLRDAVKGLEEEMSANTETLQQQLELEKQAKEEAQKAARIAASQTDALVGWFEESIGMRMGGRAGRGLSAGAAPGTVANL